MEPVDTPQKPWRQLAFVLGEAALSLLSSGVLFIVISRLSGPEMLGIYSLAFAWMILFQGGASFGIPVFIMREVGAYGRGAASQVTHAILLGLACGAAALCLMLVVVRLMGYPAEVEHVISIAGLALIPTVLTTACRSVFLALRKMHLTFVAMLVEVVITMTASLYLLLAGAGPAALLVTVVLAKLASASLGLGFVYGRVFASWPTVNVATLLRTARTIAAFGIGNVLGMFTMRINTIIVSVWADLAAVGHFAAATKVMELGLIIPSLFMQLLMTRIADSFVTHGDHDPNRFLAWYRVLFALIVPMCVGVWVFADFILGTLFGGSFVSAAWVLRVLMLYLLIETGDAVMSVVLQAAHRQREDVNRLAFNPFVNVLLSLALLPVIGTIGAAVGRVGGAIASTTLRHVYIARELTAIRWTQVALRPALISLGIGAACFVVLGAGPPALLFAVYTIVTGILLVAFAGLSPSAVKELMSYRASRP